MSDPRKQAALYYFGRGLPISKRPPVEQAGLRLLAYANELEAAARAALRAVGYNEQLNESDALRELAHLVGVDDGE